MGFNGSIIIADSGNHCIRTLLPDGKLITSAGTNTEGHVDDIGGNARFITPAVVRLAVDGSVLCADSGCHTVRRLLSQTFTEQLIEQHSVVIESVQRSVQSTLDVVDSLVATLEAAATHAHSAAVEYNTALIKAHEAMYASELVNIVGQPSSRVFIDGTSLRPDVLHGLIRVAPSIFALTPLFSFLFSPEMIALAYDALSSMLRQHCWPVDEADCVREVLCLSQLAEQHQASLVDQELLQLVLRSDTFRCSISLPTVQLLASVLAQIKFDVRRSTSQTLRRGVCYWVGKHFVLPDAEKVPFNIVIADLLQFWYKIVTGVLTEVSAQKADQDICMRTLSWMMQVHLDECF